MRVKLSLCLFILLWGVLPAAPRALLSPQELGQIEEMLGTAGLRRESLTFEKDWDLAARFKMDWQLRQLQDPWRALDDLASLRESCALEDESGIPGLLNTLGGIAFNLDTDNYANIYNAASERYTSSFSRKVRRTRDIFGWLTGHLRELKKDLSPLLESVSPREADKLLSFWLWQFIEKEDIEKYKAYYKQHKLPLQSDLDSEEIYGLLERLDLDSLQRTGLRFLALSDVLTRESARLDFPRRKPLIKKTEFGLMVIGSRGDDHYRSSELGSAPICLLLEPAGNDVYEIGLNTSHAHNFYILADFDGNDSYRSQQPAGIFRSAFGLGYSFDGAGDDLYLTDDYAFAAFAGINIHRDSSGNDIYRSGLFSQGAAMFGLALLLDEAGNDSYGAPVSAQGIGSTRGVGALLDQDGADSYLLGGKYFHEPLMPLDYITLGQGMGMDWACFTTRRATTAIWVGFMPRAQATGIPWEPCWMRAATTCTTRFTILRVPASISPVAIWWTAEETMPITAATGRDRAPGTTGAWVCWLTRAETTPIPSTGAMGWRFPIPWRSLWTVPAMTAMNAMKGKTMATRPWLGGQAASGYSWMREARTAIRTASWPMTRPGRKELTALAGI